MKAGRAGGVRAHNMTIDKRVAKGWSRHLEGWQPGVVAVFLAGSVTLLVAPRGATPDVVPEPDYDPRGAARAAATDTALAAAAARTPLDVEVRALGDAFHAYNRVVAGAFDDEVAHARRALSAASARALTVDTHGTLELRAVELERFVAAASSCAGAPVPLPTRDAAADAAARAAERAAASKRRAPIDPRRASCEELAELAAVYARREGTFRRELAGDPAALRAYFKSYWSEVTGMSEGAFAMSRDEAMAGLRFGLRHPRTQGVPGDASPAARAAHAHERGRVELRKIDEIAALDPTYPRDFARGVALFDIGELPRAVEAFRAYLERAPEGPLALRAKNHIVAASQRSVAQ
jgi:hypothetical protein